MCSFPLQTLNQTCKMQCQYISIDRFKCPFEPYKICLGTVMMTGQIKKTVVCVDLYKKATKPITLVRLPFLLNRYASAGLQQAHQKDFRNQSDELQSASLSVLGVC